MKLDLQDVLATFFHEQQDCGGEAKITNRNISEHVKDFDHSLPRGNWGRRVKIA